MNEHEVPRTPSELERLMDAVEDGDEVYLSRDGQNVAVIIGIDEWDALISQIGADDDQP